MKTGKVQLQKNELPQLEEQKKSQLRYQLPLLSNNSIQQQKELNVNFVVGNCDVVLNNIHFSILKFI